MIIVGKAHRSHILFTGTSGIRHMLDCNCPPDINVRINSPQYWGNHYTIIKRINFNIITNMRGKIIPPQPRSISDAIDDLMDL